MLIAAYFPTEPDRWLPLYLACLPDKAYSDDDRFVNVIIH